MVVIQTVASVPCAREARAVLAPNCRKCPLCARSLNYKRPSSSLYDGFVVPRAQGTNVTVCREAA